MYLEKKNHRLSEKKVLLDDEKAYMQENITSVVAEIHVSGK